MSPHGANSEFLTCRRLALGFFQQAADQRGHGHSVKLRGIEIFRKIFAKGWIYLRVGAFP